MFWENKVSPCVCLLCLKQFYLKYEEIDKIYLQNVEITIERIVISMGCSEQAAISNINYSLFFMLGYLGCNEI